MKLYRHFGKRIFDVVVSAFLLVSCSPFIALAAFVLVVANRGQILFVQDRPGLHGKVFRILKFKTMRDALGPDGQPLPDEQRLTTVGGWIRRYSLDELLQLINVLKGDMSLVGPRPLLVGYLPLYSEYHARRHEVLPGITGLAQVRGRNLLSWDEKLNYDVEYVDSLSFYLDVWILFQTVISVLTSKGISAQGMATMEKFTGSKNRQSKVDA